jgi:predicted RNase H-like HicB family nuclease
MSKGERVAAIITVGIAALITAPWFYTQLLAWKAEGHDFMLLVGNIIVTLALWVALASAIWINIRGSKRAESLRSQIVSIKDEHPLLEKDLRAQLKNRDDTVAAQTKSKEEVARLLQEALAKVREVENSAQSELYSTRQANQELQTGLTEAGRRNESLEKELASLRKEQDTVTRRKTPSRLHIHSATWWNQRRTVGRDVLTEVREKLAVDGWVFRVDTFGDIPDPEPGDDHKFVSITYTFDGWEQRTTEWEQRSFVVLPEPPDITGELRRIRRVPPGNAPKFVVKCPKSAKVLSLTNDGSDAAINIEIGQLVHVEKHEIRTIYKAFESVLAKATEEREIVVAQRQPNSTSDLWSAIRGIAMEPDPLDSVDISFDDSAGNKFRQRFALTSEVDGSVTWKSVDLSYRDASSAAMEAP